MVLIVDMPDSMREWNGTHKNHGVAHRRRGGRGGRQTYRLSGSRSLEGRQHSARDAHMWACGLVSPMTVRAKIGVVKMAKTGEVVLAFKSNVSARRYFRVAHVIRPESVHADPTCTSISFTVQNPRNAAAVLFGIRLIAVSLRLSRVGLLLVRRRSRSPVCLVHDALGLRVARSVYRVVAFVPQCP